MKGKVGAAVNATMSAGAVIGGWILRNPKTTRNCTLAVTGAAVVVAPGLVVVPALNAAGFTSGGVAAGSVAAGVQSSIGSVGAGSLFALAQSAGAGGLGLAAANTVVQGAGVMLAAAGGVLARSTK